MKSFYSFLLFIFLGSGMAQRGSSQAALILPGNKEKADPWSHLHVNNDTDNFRFAIVADNSGGSRPGVFQDALKKLDLLQPEFIMSVGDLIEGYTTDRDQLSIEWQEFNRMIDSMKIPFFYLPGNHDYMDKMSAGYWHELYGTGYYHFVYKNVLFLCLNTEESIINGSENGGIEKPQFDYISKVLAENRNVRWTLVFMHRPLWLDSNTGYWKEVDSLLAERRHTVFAGHHHSYIRYERNNGRYYVLATTGGISELKGPSFGEFDQVVWVTMTDEGPVLANLMLKGILEEDVVTGDQVKLKTYQPLMIDPIFTPDGMIRRDSIRIRISNENNYPMWTALKFDMHPVIIPEIIELQKLMPAGSSEVIDIPYFVTRNASVSNTSPIRLFGKYLFKTGDDRNIEISSEYGFLPVRPEYCNYTRQPVKVDGDLSEYNGFPYKGNSQSVITGDRNRYGGDFDGSFEFAITYDDEYLYVALSVWDDQLITDNNNPRINRDAVRLLLDARPVRESANNRGQAGYQEMLQLNFSLPESKKGSPVPDQGERLPEQIMVSTRKTLQGADVEIAIPVDYLNKMNGSPWKNFRFNLAYFDSDDHDPQNGIWWRPDWQSGENYTGSGSFFRVFPDMDK